MIKIFTTGGTIDKSYNEITGSLQIKDSKIGNLLELGKTKLELLVENLFYIDSLDMEKKHREIILNKCSSEIFDKIIITHGTDTIVDTGIFLKNQIKNKTIILTGAIIPFQVKNSEALFNLGTAIAFVQTLSHGVYIAMNGISFDPENCIKNKKTGFFEYL